MEALVVPIGARIVKLELRRLVVRFLDLMVHSNWVRAASVDFLVLPLQVPESPQSILPVEHLMCRLTRRADGLLVHVAHSRWLKEVRVSAILDAVAVVLLLHLQILERFARILYSLMTKCHFAVAVARNFLESLELLQASLILRH